MSDSALDRLLADIRACTHCAAYLPRGPRPVLRAGDFDARVMIIGQAPGTKVHATGVPWNDPSGDVLRGWMGVSRDDFYDDSRFAIMPMGFCYPGRKGGGDAPPRPECAPLWHAKIRALLPQIRLTLLIGRYAQAYYLGAARKATLGETVRGWRDYAPQGFLPLVHPSPRNRLWLRRNPWFEAELIPVLRAELRNAFEG